MVSREELDNVLQAAEGLAQSLSGVENVDKVMDIVRQAYQAGQVSRMEDQIANLLVARIYQGCGGSVTLENLCQPCGRYHDIVVSRRGRMVVNEVKRIEPECFGGRERFLSKDPLCTSDTEMPIEVKDREDTKGALERLLEEDIPKKCEQLHQDVPGVVWIVSKNPSIMRTHVGDAAREIQKRIRDGREDRYDRLTALGWLLDAVIASCFSGNPVRRTFEPVPPSHCFLLRRSLGLADVLHHQEDGCGVSDLAEG